MNKKLTQPALGQLRKAFGDLAGYVGNFKGEAKINVHPEKVVIVGGGQIGTVMELSVLINGHVQSRHFGLEKETPPLQEIDKALNDLAVAIHYARLDTDERVSMDVASNFIESAKRLMVDIQAS